MDHIKKEDQQKAREYLHWYRYSSLQARRNMKLGNIELAEQFNRDSNMYLAEFKRMTKKKQEEDQLFLLLKQTDGQLQIDKWKEHYKV